MREHSMEKAFNDLGDKVQINVKHLKANTVLNCPTYDEDGNEIQTAYTPFTQELINGLLEKNIDHIYYTKLKNVDAVIYQKNLKDYLNKNVYQGPRTIKVDTQKKAISVMENITDALKNRKELDFTDSNKLMDNLIDDISRSKVEIINLLDIQAFDDYTYSHSLNVGIIGMTFGMKLNMDEKTIKNIGLGGFLHDIGKIRIPYDILRKEDKLNEKELKVVKNHSRYGYEMIKDSKELDDLVKKIVLLHHEKYDGSGYPFGFKEQQLDDAVTAIALAEVYDTLTSQLPYCSPIAPKEALKVILKNAGSHFKPELAHLFAKNMGHLLKENQFYQVGDYVILSTNEVGKVISKDSEITSRPGLEIIQNSKGDFLTKPLSINLNVDGSRDIVRKLNIDEVLKIKGLEEEANQEIDWWPEEL